MNEDKVIAVASEVLKRSNAAGVAVDYRKLAMMMYYIQGLYYAEFRKFMMNEDFFAWDCGPTLKSIHDVFNANGGRALEIDKSLQQWRSLPLLKKNEKKIINLVVVALAPYDGSKLMHKSFMSKPWNVGHRREDKLITKESIEEEFGGYIYDE